ncbi:hypothetical protein ElyMa_000466000 [Elysia marginata]|uniref:Uncharacterized protein n=1 Tax=Elysia marginata TaxID=1093978 RepID=A0AAV4FQT3_9GAST|nr:hypothetical protein ElyMa_000466000 [Elysia marginata]
MVRHSLTPRDCQDARLTTATPAIASFHAPADLNARASSLVNLAGQVRADTNSSMAWQRCRATQTETLLPDNHRDRRCDAPHTCGPKATLQSLCHDSGCG